MECKDFEKHIFEYIEGSLDEPRKSGFLSHKEHCAECAEMYDFIANGYDIISVESKVEVKPFLYTRIQGRVQAPVQRKSVLRLIPAFATVLVLGLMFGFFVSTLTMNRQVTEYQEYELAYLFNEVQIENVESNLLSN